MSSGLKRLGNLYSTRVSEAFEAVQEGMEEHVLLWIMRYPLTADSQASEQFLRRIRIVQGLGLSTPDIKDFGIDEQGYPFLITRLVPGKSIISSESISNTQEREEFFKKIVSEVARLHEHDIILGDISEDTFVIDNLKRIMLVGILGTFDMAAKRTARLPPPKTLHFLSPEQRSATSPVPASDVYALGVLAYRLLTGKYPHDEQQQLTGSTGVSSSTPAPSALCHDISAKMDNILARCLEAKPENRFANAGELLQALESEDLDSAANSGKWSRRSVLVHKSTTSSVNEKNSNRNKKTKNKISSIVLAGAIIAVILALYFYTSDTPVHVKKVVKGNTFCEGQEFVSEELNELKTSYCKSSSAQEKEKILQVISKTEDPEIPLMLFSLMSNEEAMGVRLTAERQFIKLMQEKQLEITSEAFLNWFRVRHKVDEHALKNPVFTYVLRSLDETLSDKSRKFAIQRAMQEDKVIGLELKTALVLDGISLIEEPLNELLEQLALFDSPMLYVAAEVLLKRGGSISSQRVFLEALVNLDKFRTPARVKQSLVRAAFSHVEEKDLAALSQWTGEEAEKVLLAFCAMPDEQKIGMKALEVLASRSLLTEPAQGLIAWLKKHLWEKRGDLVRAIGILGIYQQSTDEDFEYAFDKLVAYAGGGLLLDIFLKTNEPRLMVPALERLGLAASSSVLLQLLKHENKSIRVVAIKSLAGRNDLDTLQSIVHACEREEDPEVKNLYREVHWVAKDRCR